MTTKRIYNTITNYKMKKQCIVLNAEKKQSTFFFFYLLVRTDRTVETKRALHERDTHTAPVFVHDTTSFLFVAMYCREKRNWIVLCTKHQKQRCLGGGGGLGPSSIKKTVSKGGPGKLLKSVKTLIVNV